jgi:hypothetical protein
MEPIMQFATAVFMARNVTTNRAEGKRVARAA